MRMGKITQTAWQRSVRNRLHTGKENMLFGPSPWETCSGFVSEAGERYVWSDACVVGDGARTGYYAVYHAVGELAARGVCAEGAAVRVLLPPGSEEEMLGGIAAGADCACRELGIQATGIQGGVSGAVLDTVVFASAAGIMQGQTQAQTNDCVKTTYDRQREHQEIILCGYAGLEGTLRIVDAAREELETRFVPAFLEQTEALTKALIRPRQIVEVFAQDEEAQVRQIGGGGVLAALWELAETAHIGFEISMPQILLKQETVEICEAFRLNPYLMTSTGSYIVLTSKAENVIRALEQAGVRASRLGTGNQQNARLIRNGEDVRYLDRPAPDEMERWRLERLRNDDEKTEGKRGK